MLTYSLGYSQIKISDEKYLQNFTHYDTSSFNFQKLFYTLSSESKYFINLDLKNYGSYQLEISPSQLMLEQADNFMVFKDKKIQVQNADMALHFWKGKAVGTDKIARLNVYSNELSGYVETDTGFVYFETIRIEGKNTLLIYNTSESKNDELRSICGLKDELTTQENSLNKKSVTYEVHSCKIVKLASIAAYGRFKKNNFDSTATFNEMKNIVNLSDGIYSKYIGIRLRIASNAISMDSLSPLNASGSIDSRLIDLKNKRLQFTGKITPDIYHLFTEGFSSVENADGVAYLGTTCNASNVSLSIGNGGISRHTIILCHELGHNLNAKHSDAFYCGTANGTIMCGQANTLVFGSAEINVIKKYISDKFAISPPSTCLSYPIDVNVSEINLCDKDSGLLVAKRLTDFHQFLYHEDVVVNNLIDKDINFWVKKTGTYRIRYTSDTLNSVYCYLDKEVYVSKRNYLVTNVKETGLGSLKYAILNANTCKGNDTIMFKLPNHINTIAISKPLPPIIDNTMVDGTSQLGYKLPEANKPYQPSIILQNNLPSTTYLKYCFLINRGRHTIQGLEFRDFENAITNNTYGFNNTPYSYLYNPANQNAEASIKVFGNKFINCTMGIYLVYDDTVSFNDRTEIGNGTLKQANFFNSQKGTGIRLAFTQSASINGNYFGAEPGIDTTGKVNNPIATNQCNTDFKIVNNHFGNSQWMGLYLFATSGMILNNTFGLNPFNNNIIGLKGTAINVEAYYQNQALNIGGTSVNEGNKIYNQKRNLGNNGILVSNALKNLTFIGNTVINPDTTSVILNFAKANHPIKTLSLDSTIHSCKNSNSLQIFGSLVPKLKNDTFYLHFYSTPDYVQKGHEPMKNYLGTKTIITSDTIKVSFSHTLSGCSLNEGLVFTATSQKTNHTSFLSNVMYARNAQSIKIASLKDTILCPSQEISLNLNGDLSNFKMNLLPIDKNTKINKSGFFALSAIDKNGCTIGQSFIINYSPNYLNNKIISGTDYYNYNTVYPFSLVDLQNIKKWSIFKWSATNGDIDNLNKFETNAVLRKDTAIIKYQITDVNKCTYSITKVLLHNTLSVKQIEESNKISIFPNPSDGLYTINLTEPQRMFIYSVTGELLKSYDENIKNRILDISEFKKGVYILSIENYGNYKLLKQ